MTYEVTKISTLAEQIMTVVQQARQDEVAEWIGLRVDDEVDLQVGQILDGSRIWIDGEPTEETLDGTCAIDTANLGRALRLAASYFGDRVSIIVGTYAQAGEDDCEIIIRDAQVHATWTLPRD